MAADARDSDLVIVYLHGSALRRSGSTAPPVRLQTVGDHAARVLNVGYRLAPQAGIEEAVRRPDAYRHVLSLGVAP